MHIKPKVHRGHELSLYVIDSHLYPCFLVHCHLKVSPLIEREWNRGCIVIVIVFFGECVYAEMILIIRPESKDVTELEHVVLV